MEIRFAASSDLQSILKITNHAIENTTAIYEYEPKTIDWINSWFEEKQSNNFPIFVACINDEVIGFSYYSKFRARIGYQHTIEHSLYVHQQHQGKGIGKALMEQLIKSATKNKFHVMIARIDASNKGSIAFHEKFGFEIAGTLKEVGYKFDQWLDVVYMQKILPK